MLSLRGYSPVVNKNVGYELPPGEAFTDELCCALVFYPDKDAYRRALLGAVGYFATWTAWERDASKRGVDASRAWKLAYARTLECWNMACLDDLIDDMAAIRALMETRKDCCDGNVTYDIQDVLGTTIDPRVGDPPDYYGETAVSDWDDWSEHVCYNAHLYVDNLKNIGNQMNGAVEQSSLFLGLIAAGLVLLSFSGIGLPIAYLLASFVVSGLVLAATSTTFENTADDLEDARELIVCALLTGTSLAEVVEDALSSATDWDLFYQFVDYDSATAIIYEGGADGDYLPAETRDDCTCTQGYELVLLEAPAGNVVDQTHFSAVFATSCWYCAQLRVAIAGTSTYRPFKIISIGAISGGCASKNVYRVWDYPSENLIWDSATPPSDLSNCKFIAIISATDFGTKELLWTVE